MPKIEDLQEVFDFYQDFLDMGEELYDLLTSKDYKMLKVKERDGIRYLFYYKEKLVGEVKTDEEGYFLEPRDVDKILTNPYTWAVAVYEGNLSKKEALSMARKLMKAKARLETALEEL